ncbi:unnamed protein product [Lactuca virosa]|uniref:Uncharacterized protein n=1 Tax=Lactuca virosa TaxID=75947 RepID=A0AAU9NC09_9ASTR|nr:unnamed protein product [Lactuca virosa]
MAGKRKESTAATGGGGAGVKVAVRWLNRRNTTGAWLIEGGRKRGWQQSHCRQFVQQGCSGGSWLSSTAMVAEQSSSGCSPANPRGFLSHHRKISTSGGGLG